MATRVRILSEWAERLQLRGGSQLLANFHANGLVFREKVSHTESAFLGEVDQKGGQPCLMLRRFSYGVRVVAY